LVSDKRVFQRGGGWTQLGKLLLGCNVLRPNRMRAHFVSLGSGH
jgi:hypothetical protein